MKFEPFKLSAVEIADQVRQRQVSAGDVCEFFIHRSEQLQASLNSFVLWDKSALERSVEKQLDYLAAALKLGKNLPLAGVPVAIKDNISVKDQLLTCGSKMLAHYRATYDASVISKLREAGAIVWAKTNMDEFGMGSTGESSYFGPSSNPWDTTKVAGGSSSGSAAAVAAYQVPLSLGSDTGGSIRQPASFCGLFGLKPTYGMVSRFGLVSYGSSLDQIGGLARSVDDLQLLHHIIVGADNKDTTSQSFNLEKTKISEDLKGLKLAVIQDWLEHPGLDESVARQMELAIQDLETLGAVVQRVRLESLEFAVAAYYIIATAEASSNLSRFDGIRYGHRSDQKANLKQLYKSSRSEGFGSEVKKRIMLGCFALSSGYYDAYYEKACRVRALIRKELDELLLDFDAIVGPSAPQSAFSFGDFNQDPLSLYIADIYTTVANLGGHPAISIPCGYTEQRLPVGLQMIASHGADQLLLDTARVYERLRRWNDESKPSC